MVNNKPEKDCCGCGACEQICPVKAITLEENTKGFIFPKINTQVCVDCGLCNNVCPLEENESVLSSPDPDILIALNKNNEVRANSTSGGMFTVLSDYVLNKGGVIYGAAFSEDMSVHHKRAMTAEERNKFRFSKYVQSYIDNTYILAKNDLENGLTVLYSGTPCQIAGLKKFLGKSYDNLLTVDIVCHGVPSNKLWQEFLSVVQKKTGCKVVDANFRDKSQRGWHNPKLSLVYSSETQKNFFGEQTFLQLFYDNLSLRDSCLYCKFLTYERPGDFTLGDYWGIERFCKEMDDNKGTSLALINTEKAQRVFNCVKESLNFRYSDKEHCYSGQLMGRSYINPKTDTFWEEYVNKGFVYVWKKYTNYSCFKTYRIKAVNKIKRVITKTFKRKG